MTNDMQPPLKQPIGFWTIRAGEAVRARIRSRLAEIGLTQPEWWLLHQLSLHPEGMDENDAIAMISPNDTEDAIITAVADASAKGWIDHRESMLTLTSVGTDLFHNAARIQAELEAERRQGISDDEYATTITVLQRTARNVGSDAWHW